MMLEPEDYSTYVLLNRMAELVFQIQGIDKEQGERRELLTSIFIFENNRRSRIMEGNTERQREESIVIRANEAYEEENEALRAAGCQVKIRGEIREITFPPGTQREFYHRTAHDHLLITLPDTREIKAFETYTREGIYNLRYGQNFFKIFPTFKEARKKHGVSLVDLVKATWLRISVIRLIDEKGEGKPEHIDTLLQALSHLAGEQYSRWNMRGFKLI